MNKLDRVIMIKQDLERYNEQEFPIECHDSHITQASKHEYDHVTLIKHEDTNVHQGKIHLEMHTRTRVCGYCIYHSTRKYSQCRCNASNHYTPWLTVY
ncbi:hypothetical protein Taro_015991 [Colocasia esculenta]|uniref:Uncharacterized protein n=1 Tax=Colocasia esculenta TaxID=4460 RepID=A0A843UMM9_COLES|nr:hypothetical protein [Colocasia esculenta]